MHAAQPSRRAASTEAVPRFCAAARTQSVRPLCRVNWRAEKIVEKNARRAIVYGMKKSIILLCAAVASLLCSCIAPQIKRESVSFEGLKTFYVEAPQNGAEIFRKYRNEASINKTVVDEIAANLKAKGFVQAAKEEAEIVFVPVWSAAIRDSDKLNESLTIKPLQESGAAFARSGEISYYATLEIQALRKGDSRWGWRGFSPMEIDPESATTAAIKDQIVWALEFFPPEKYPEPSVPILDIFTSSSVTEGELAAREQKVKERQLQEQKTAQIQQRNAEIKAQQKLEKSGAPKNAKPTQAQIEAEKKPATIAEIDAAFSKNLGKKSSE